MAENANKRTSNLQNGTPSVGQRMHAFAADLYPICRSITGEGLRETLIKIQERIGIDIVAVASGTSVLDWEIPKEWKIRDAYVLDGEGRKLIDFQQHNLHVLNYSEPVDKTVTLAELQPHLHSLPDTPELIPYRTSYYNRTWGFCVPHRVRESMAPDDYRVVIDSSLEEGHLHYGELLIPGETKNEVLLSTHVCHPSLANDNLSGIALLTSLAEHLLQRRRRFTYRLLFVPGTIGSIAWLSKNEEVVPRIRHGLVAACVGDVGHFHYKKSRRGDAEVDRVVEHVLSRSGNPFSIRDFTPYGYDERQYCSPGFNLPVGSLTRTPHGEYPEYHTSADNLDLISAKALQGSFDCYRSVLELLDGNRTFRNVLPNGEPQLGRRGLYSLLVAIRMRRKTKWQCCGC